VIARTSSRSSQPSPARWTRPGFSIVASGLRQCLAPENADHAVIDTAKLERLFLSLA